ncbi:hypothetical protein [Legionella micdadei]|uniref:Fe-S protein n=1 Tax=Legionella micdadei TaxID=451 RepID=A0A098GBP4_LEGMI|nr:hypothetical protein [Legionella micdadei]ARG96210.1 hypothetical protein B6N58_00050 [Legionella micdadei]ARG98965.1 hypothetical protein B6V88_00050 [Legionella micdadei]KTD29022.1 Fe-S protein [Legionella micdadei]NSL17233.1 hypothetical protein [Legionella micdadei]CEG59385.1 conserved exported protein of unknown function [Legionella micdadei]
MYLRVFFLLLFTNVAMAGPWWTGPLLAPAGKTIPAGHFNFEPYGFYTTYPAHFKNIEIVPILTAGLTDFLDLQTALPYDYSWVDHQHASEIADYSLALGIQLLRQKEKSWVPDLRVTIQEIFPTGRFENLDPRKLGTEQTGIGSYITSFGFNFQKLWELRNQHYLRGRLSLVAAFPGSSSVHGINAFGGTDLTEGSVHPGNIYSADLAFEYSLTQHWAPVFEVLYVHSSNTGFSGNPGFTPGGTLASIGGAGGDSVSLAPALEFNFTSSLGIIGGIWFSVTGPHASKFTTGAIAVNYFF